MQKHLLAAAIAATLAVALPATAAASPYNRNCATHTDGFLVGPASGAAEPPWVVYGPWHINLAAAESAKLARQQPVEEFGHHVNPRTEMPCRLAEGIAFSASKAWWQQWPQDNGWARVFTSGEGGSKYIGRFYCTGVNLDAPNQARETCTMRYPGGRIVGSFTISNNPYF